jgi:hypothetical protein
MRFGLGSVAARARVASAWVDVASGPRAGEKCAVVVTHMDRVDGSIARQSVNETDTKKVIEALKKDG